MKVRSILCIISTLISISSIPIQAQSQASAISSRCLARGERDCSNPARSSDRMLARLSVDRMLQNPDSPGDPQHSAAYVRRVSEITINTVSLESGGERIKVLRVPMPWLPATTSTGSASYFVKLSGIRGQVVFEEDGAPRVFRISSRNTTLRTARLVPDSTGLVTAEVVVDVSGQ